MTNKSLPRVAVIGTGGTMSSLGTSSLDLMDYPDYGQKLDITEVLARVPEAAQVADIVPVPFRAIGSTKITYEDWVAMRDTIRRMVREQPDIAGFVITHGTATLEETAFFLDLTLDVEQTVVLVGAQRPLSAVSSDSPLNLIAALKVAGAAESRGRGVLVVLNDEIHPARDVIKTATLRLQTFRSADFGALGVVDPDGIQYFRRSERAHAPHGPFVGLAQDAVPPRVDIVYSYVGADETFIEAALAKGARGIVSASLAPGIPTNAEKAALEAAARAGTAVVICTRAHTGRVAHRRYLSDVGFISGEDLSPQKARIVLALGLAQGMDTEALRRVFEAV